MVGRHPQPPLLESSWDVKHRARVVAEGRLVSIVICFLLSILLFLFICCNRRTILNIILVIIQLLHLLRICTHNPMMWDEWYSLFIRRMGFLPLARLIIGGLPMMDFAALMTPIDRRRPETHTFHLPCDETTVTLQDIATILSLPIDVNPVCGLVSPGGWRDRVRAPIGIRPSDVSPDQKDKKSSGIHSRWLTTNFENCPEDANDGVVQRYARA
jgi:hypothetical protein